MPPPWRATPNSSENWPAWYVQRRASRPDHDCRARCPACSGTGIWDGAQWAIGECRACRGSVSELPCPQHGCKVCRGCGLVCPVCLGFRLVRRDVPVGHPDFGRELICTACCEGNQVSDVKERREIARYLQTYQPTDREVREAARRADAAASYAEYVQVNGDSRARYTGAPGGGRRPRQRPPVRDLTPAEVAAQLAASGD